MKIEPQESSELSLEFANEVAADLEINVNENIVQPQEEEKASSPLSPVSSSSFVHHDAYSSEDEEEKKECVSPEFPPVQCSSYV